MKNILYLRPRTHHKVLKKGDLRRARVLFEGITGDGLKSNLVKEKKRYSLMWFDSRREGEDANCLHYDFSYDKPFCPGVTIAPTTKKPEVTKPVAKTTTAPVVVTTKPVVKSTTAKPGTTKPVTTKPEEIDLVEWCSSKTPGTYKHPQSCFSYVQCAPGYGVKHACPDGTIWDGRIKNCNWIAAVENCKECVCNGQTTVTTRAPTTVAPTGEPGPGPGPTTGNDHCPEHEVLG